MLKVELLITKEENTGLERVAGVAAQRFCERVLEWTVGKARSDDSGVKTGGKKRMTFVLAVL